MLELKVRVSAPGKALLFGEHAVVYGKPSITLAIDKRVTIDARRTEEKTIRVRARDLQLSGLDVKLSLSSEKIQFKTDYERLRNALKYVNVAAKNTFKKYNVDGGLDVSIKSELIVGAGTGSSAAITVATIKAISELFDLNLNDKEIFELGVETKQEIDKKVSGSDIAASTFGGIVYYKCGKVEKIKTNLKLPIILGYSKISGKTSEMVGKVLEMKQKYPKAVNSIFNSMEEVTDEGRRILEKNGPVERLGELMNINQGLLDALGVNMYKLSQLIYAARNAGGLGAKISGAGGGKCIIVLAKKENLNLISKSIELFDGLPIITKISETGVRVEK